MGLWRFKLHRKWIKGCTISSFCFLGNGTKKWFLTNWGWNKNILGVHEHSKFWKKFTARWVRLWTTNKYSFKLGSHSGDEHHLPPSSPVINLVGTIEGLLLNLHLRRWLGRWISKSFDIHRPSSSPNHMNFLSCRKRCKN